MTERNRDAASISFEAVGKAFAKPGGGTVHALEDVSLRVEPGSITGIIGRSGAGKSTLLRMVNGWNARHRVVFWWARMMSAPHAVARCATFAATWA